MPSLSVDGLNGFMLSMEELMDIPDSVQDEMLIAGAKVVEGAQLASGMKLGVYLTGETLHATTVRKPKRGPDGRSISVYPQGTNSDGNRNAEVAFLNEYGVPSKDMPAKQYIRLANEESAEATTQAEADVYYGWQESIGL